MIDVLDVRTLFFVMTATAMLAAVATTILWISHPNEPALPPWAIGATMAACGHLCIAMRGAVPMFVSIVVANVLVAVGHTLFLDGARRFFGDPRLPRRVLVGVALYITVPFYYYSAIDNNTAIRIAIQFICTSAVSLVTGWQFWRHAGAIRGSVARVVAVSFWLIAVLLLVRVGLYVLEPPDQNFFRPDRSHQVAFFLFILFYSSLMYSFPVLLISKELTRREAAEAELRRNESALADYAALMEHSAQSLEEAQRIANVGSWDYDPATRQITWSTETFRIFRRDPALGPPSLDDYLDLIHPDDRPRLLSHMKLMAQTSQPYDVELRHLRPDGSYSYTVTRARPVFENGRLTKAIGSIQDITAYKLAEAKLQESEQQLRSILDSSPIAVRILTMAEHTICLANPAYARLLNADPAALIGTNPVWAYVRPEEYVQVLETLRRGEAVTNILLELQIAVDPGNDIASGVAPTRTVWVLASYFPIRYQNREASLAWFVDVTELRLAQEAAESANVAKSAFLANMSHEIRTPMNAVLGLTNLAMRRTSDPQQRDYLEKVEQAGRHLMGIINDILDFSKIEAGRFDIEHLPFALSTAIDNLHQMQEYRAVEKGLHFRISVSADVPETLRGDPLRIGQVLINFVSNAIKFTEQGGIDIAVTLASRDAATARLKFAVSDTGPGIAPDVLPGLFEPFRQADASINRRYGGTGLGLAISRQIAELMGGEIGATSTPGSGSCFWLEVPLGIESAAAAEPPRPELISNSTSWLRLRGKRVLVAEDNSFNQQVAQELLDDVGIAVVLAQNGQEAIDWLDREKFDAILMDMQMPVMDGLAATEVIRRRPDGAQLPVIAMTANARREDERACRDAGMNDFVSKPIQPEVLYALLVRWLCPMDELQNAGAKPDAQPATLSAGTPVAPVLLNREALAKLGHGRPGRAEKLFASYLDSVERALGQLEAACSQGEFAAFRAIGHQLKSASRWVGAESIAALCIELEMLSADRAPVRAPEIRQEIADLLPRLKAEFAISTDSPANPVA